MELNAAASHSGHLDTEALLELYRISTEDLNRVREFGKFAVKKMDKMIKSENKVQPSRTDVEVDRKTIEELKSLGYMG